MRSFTVAALTALLVLGLAGPAMASTSVGRDARVVLTGGLTLDPDERSDTIVVFNGPVVVDGTVDGSVVVFNGRVSVSGTIRDDLVVLNGAVTVNDGARIGGDVVTRQVPSIAPGATVGGKLRRTSGQIKFGFLGRFVVWVAYSVSVFVLGLLLLLLLPRGMEAAAAASRERTGPAIGWGFAMFFGLPIAAFLLLITLVGIPLGVGILLSLFLLSAVGYTTTVWIVGRLIMKPPAGRVLAFFIGWLILRAAGLIPVAGGILWFAAALFGLGTLVVAAWHARSGPGAFDAPPPAPPAPTYSSVPLPPPPS
jgi:hypothetical protein